MGVDALPARTNGRVPSVDKGPATLDVRSCGGQPRLGSSVLRETWVRTRVVVPSRRSRLDSPSRSAGNQTGTLFLRYLRNRVLPWPRRSTVGNTPAIELVWVDTAVSKATIFPRLRNITGNGYRQRVHPGALSLFLTGVDFVMAEREGFEPSIEFPIHAFQACAFNHSGDHLSGYRNRGLSHRIAWRSPTPTGRDALT